jgi:hypothetical protein
LQPVIIRRAGVEMIEFPQSVVDLGVARISCFGGGYFRLFPKEIIHLMAGFIRRKNRPLILYIHPRDLDPDQPKMPFSLTERLRYYLNVEKTEKKLDNISGRYRFSSFQMLAKDPDYVRSLSYFNMVTSA